MSGVPENWHEDFFDGLWLDVQKHSFDAAQTRELVDAIQEALQLSASDSVLDVPCGEGRVALELAARGIAVTGVDRTAAFLDAARAEAERRDLDVTWREEDMWRLDVEAAFDHAVCMWGSIGYGSEDDDAAFFRAIAERLRPGGRLMIDTHVMESLLPWYEPSGFRWAGDVGVAETRHFDPETGRIETEWVLSGPDRRERKHSSLRLYSFRDLTRALSDAGFGDFEAFGSTDLEPFELGSSRLLLSAARREPVSADESAGSR